MNEGWSCPACNSAHSPDVKTCPNKIPFVPLVPYVPYVPEPTFVPYDRCPRCGATGPHTCIWVGDITPFGGSSVG